MSFIYSKSRIIQRRRQLWVQQKKIQGSNCCIYWGNQGEMWWCSSQCHPLHKQSNSTNMSGLVLICLQLLPANWNRPFANGTRCNILCREFQIPVFNWKLLELKSLISGQWINCSPLLFFFWSTLIYQMAILQLDSIHCTRGP